ncbi:MAG TPA: hypothetical protein P5547_13490 [Spirochaetota bacterium]|nr:hypothetical protein [Spirochaetota bacterium]HRR61939.1 hypothetical protein [Spirochaetota bacterium]
MPAKNKKQTAKKSEKELKQKTNTNNDNIHQYVKAINIILKKLDEESLAFLYEQAKVLLHNLEVAKLREEFEELDVKAIASKHYNFSKEKLEVVEADDLRYFIFVINGARNFFTRDEMRTIVKLCHSAPSLKDGMRMLYNWFEKNRKDVIIDTEIDGPNDKALETIYNYIINHYTVPNQNK